MGTAASAEPCVYERLWESIAVLRESGQRYGMSERDIERFITQVLQTNENRDQDRDQDQGLDYPHVPLLRAMVKCALALCLLLVLGLGLSPPQSASGPLSLGWNWTCPLGAARLLELPIARKYNLQGVSFWWGNSAALRPTVNSSVCAEEQPPLVIKGGERWRLQRSDLELLLQSHPDAVSVRAEGDLSFCPGPPHEPSNFSVHWRPTGGAAESLLPLLFPAAQPPLLDSGGTALRRCVVSHLRPSPPHLHGQGVPVQSWVLLGAGRASLSLSPRCPHHRTSRLQLTPGDMVFCDARRWRTELFPGAELSVFCDGSGP